MYISNAAPKLRIAVNAALSDAKRLFVTLLSSLDEKRVYSVEIYDIIEQKEVDYQERTTESLCSCCVLLFHNSRTMRHCVVSFTLSNQR
jgi:hypothetical protein